MLEAKIIEVELNDGFQSGINWAGLNNNGQTAIGQDGINTGTVNGVNIGGQLRTC